MKIAIVGAKGMLGSEIADTLRPVHRIEALDIEEIDITKRDETIELLTRVRPDIIINAAALVDVDACERNPDMAWAVNAVGAHNLAIVARSIGCELLYISSNYVFDGEPEKSGFDPDHDYDELNAPNPINHYGRSKLAGERLSMGVNPRTYALRISWLFGHRAGNYVDRVLGAYARDGVVRMAADQMEAPTYSVHVAQAIATLIESHAYGLYNFCGGEGCTRVDFARYVLACARARRDGVGLPDDAVPPDDTATSADVQRIDHVPPGRIARRPRRVTLDCRYFRLAMGVELPSWRDGVRRYLERESRNGEG